MSICSMPPTATMPWMIARSARASSKPHRQADALRRLRGDLPPRAAHGATETIRLFDEMPPRSAADRPLLVTGPDDIAAAVRHFFAAEAQAAADRGRRAARHERGLAQTTSRDWRSSRAQLGLDWSPVIFEAVPDSFMTEMAVYGLPVRMPHWSFGARYIYQLVQRHMGYLAAVRGRVSGQSRAMPIVASSNGLADNILVTAHVLGHADFSQNNLLFRRCQEQVSEHIVEHAANHARQIERHIESLRHRGRRAGARCGAVARAVHRRRSAAAPRALSGVS